MRCNNYIQLLCIYPTCLHIYMHSYSTIWYAHIFLFRQAITYIPPEQNFHHIRNPWGSAMAPSSAILKFSLLHVHITHLNRVDIWQILQAAVQSAMMTFALLSGLVVHLVSSRVTIGSRNSGILGCSNLWRLREVAPDWNSNMIIAPPGLSSLLKLFHTGRRRYPLVN